MNKKIILSVGDRLYSSKHTVVSAYDRTAVIHVLRNMADLLENEHPSIKFKEAPHASK